MGLFRWLPWQWLLRRIARAHGFLDPVALLRRLERFGQPAEVAVPMELLRAGVVFHARGLMNSRAIQSNLDWVWPYWVQRQFDPADESFLPRSFSITHVNLTHRNWTAVGLPDVRALPIVDPRGLLTPHFDGWSLDVWLLADSGAEILPSRAREASQELLWDAGRLAVRTRLTQDDLALSMSAWGERQDNRPVCCLACAGRSAGPAWLVVALRPYNPEGLSPLERVAWDGDRGWLVGNRPAAHFSEPPDRHAAAAYAHGDVYHRLRQRSPCASVACDVGMATAAALFRVEEGRQRTIDVRVPLSDAETGTAPSAAQPATTWDQAIQGAAQLAIPDDRMRFLFDAALRTMVLHAPEDVVPGPYTYKRFWFRDAAFILHAMLCAGLQERAGRVIKRFPRRQRADGYFHSQEGEWDSNGQVLWILARWAALTDKPLDPVWRGPVERGAEWIRNKRCNAPESLHHGLLPAGFSAEHLGNTDYYYWDDFWAAAGLRAAGTLCEAWGDLDAARRFRDAGADLLRAVETSLERSASIRLHEGIPASPYRRMDAGAVGSIVAGYPLGLLDPDDARLSATAAFLLDFCSVQDAFFQDMVHSGINAYLTLHLAQVLLRAGDARYADGVRAVARLATPTGQWPEAIHPRTGGGCMGDGQHVWAAAEWVMMLRSLFVREEAGGLVLAAGLLPEWLTPGARLSFGPAPTPSGALTVRVAVEPDEAEVSWEAAGERRVPCVRVALPGHEAHQVTESGAGSARVRRLPAEQRPGT